MLKFLQKYKEKREQKLIEKQNRDKWILVAQLSATYTYVYTHPYSFSLYENLLDERKFVFNIDKKKLNNYTEFNYNSSNIYHTIVAPWLSGVNFQDIPDSFSILFQTKQQYLKHYV